MAELEALAEENEELLSRYGGESVWRERIENLVLIMKHWKKIKEEEDLRRESKGKKEKKVMELVLEDSVQDFSEKEFFELADMAVSEYKLMEERSVNQEQIFSDLRERVLGLVHSGEFETSKIP